MPRQMPVAPREPPPGLPRKRGRGRREQAAGETERQAGVKQAGGWSGGEEIPSPRERGEDG